MTKETKQFIKHAIIGGFIIFFSMAAAVEYKHFRMSSILARMEALSKGSK
jgi:hypothetical protein